MTISARINVYLTFSGNCREAMTFYQHIFGGDLTIMTAADAGMADMMPPEMKDCIMHASLVNGNLMLLGSDTGNPETEVNGNTVSLEVDCPDTTKMQEYYDRLSYEGEGLRAPHDFPQGRIASVNDKYGKNWILYFDNTDSKNIQ